MKKFLSIMVVLAMLAALIVGCADVEPNFTYDTRPGESDATGGDATGGTGEDSADGTEGTGGNNGSAGSEGSEGGNTGAATPKPEMVGNVVYKFYTTMQVSGSLGGMSTLEIYVELYDTPNADGYVGVLGTNNGGSISYTTYDNWTLLDDGNISIQVDEFSTMETVTVEGKLYFTGVAYSGSMPGSSNYADVPQVDLSFETPVWETEEPEASDPAGSEPVGSEPVGSEPVGSDPAGTEGSDSGEGESTPATETPAASDPAGTESAGGEDSESGEGESQPAA